MSFLISTWIAHNIVGKPGIAGQLGPTWRGGPPPISLKSWRHRPMASNTFLKLFSYCLGLDFGPHVGPMLGAFGSYARAQDEVLS